MITVSILKIKKEENHREEELWISLRGWLKSERNLQRYEQIKLILGELYFEKHGFNKK